jgi:hypothetical protein
VRVRLALVLNSSLFIHDVDTCFVERDSTRGLCDSVGLSLTLNGHSHDRRGLYGNTGINGTLASQWGGMTVLEEL